jgi:ribonuclease P protein component
VRTQSNEAHLSAESRTTKAETRFSCPYEDEWRAERASSPSGEGSQASRGVRGFQVVVELRTDRLRRSDRLLDSRDYRRVSRQGSRAASNSFVLLLAPGRGSEPDGRSPGGLRLGLTVSRRVGNAVVRNRVKRRIREWFRRLGEDAASDLDLVVIARRSAADFESGESAKELSRLFKQVNSHAEARRGRREDG